MATVKKTIVKRPAVVSTAKTIVKRPAAPVAAKAPVKAPAQTKAPQAAPQAVRTPVVDETRRKQQAELVRVTNELVVAESMQDDANQASIWTYNAMGQTDAFVDKKKFAPIIKQSEQATALVDALRDASKALVESLRSEKRELTKVLGHFANEKVVANLHKTEQAAIRTEVANVKNAKTVKTTAPAPKAPVAKPIANGKPKPSFRAFIESKGNKWPLTPKHPKYASLKEAYGKL